MLNYFVIAKSGPRLSGLLRDEGGHLSEKSDKGKVLFKEEDLFEPLAEYFNEQGYKIDAEVHNCDITAIKGDELVVVEIKKSLNLTLVIQAVKRQDFADSVYVAIPGFLKRKFPSNWKGACKVLKRLELGLILVNPTAYKRKIEIIFHPAEPVRRKMRKKRRAVISESKGRLVNLNKGGSTGAKLMTAYRENSLQIALYLNHLGEASPAKLRELGTGAKTPGILAKNFYHWFERVKRGVYSVTEKGIEALELYPEIKEYYNGKLEEILSKKKD